jgi:HEAT repeat protein
MKIPLLLPCLLLPFSMAGMDRGALLAERLGDLDAKVPAVRARAATLLGEMGNRAASPELIEALEDPEKAVRREAARALGRLRESRAVDALVRAMRDRDPNVRLYAAHSLGEIRDSKARQALIDALSDNRYGVREEAAWALRELRDPEVALRLATLLEDPETDAGPIGWVLQHVGDRAAVKALAPLLAKAENRTRRRAVRVLAALESEAAVPELTRAVSDRDFVVRRTAVEALRETREEPVIAAFRKALAREEEPELRQLLEEALEELTRDPRLIAWWSFDDGDTAVAKDGTGRGTDGRIIRCRAVKGKVGRALAFGPGRYVELGKPAALELSGRPRTILAWILPRAERGVVVARGGAFCGYSLYLLDGVAKFGIHRFEDGPGYVAAARDPLGPGWTHLAGVVEKDRIRLYVNGKLAAQTPTTGYLPSECGQGMEIGFDAGNSPAEICDSFEGVIDEVKVFNVALTAEDIAREAEAGD